MKRLPVVIIKSLITILIGSGVLAANLQAQSEPITVSVPFPFTVGTQSIAPGTYKFSLIPDGLVSSQCLLSVLDLKTGSVKMFEVRPERQRTVEQRGHVTFRDTGGRSVLAEVHFPGTDTFSELIPRRSVGKNEAMLHSTSKSVSAAQR